MSVSVFELFLIVLWSAFKYMVGFFMALGYGLNYVETILTTTTGGFLGVIVYLYLWDLLVKIKHKIFPPHPSPGIKINKKRRWLVKMINKYEVYGIVILTPVFLSVPVGTILASMIEKNKWKIKVLMFISFVAWGSVLYGLYRLFGIRLDEVIGKLF